MLSIILQKTLVQQAMIFDKKSFSERITKLSEEQGELGEAIILKDYDESVEEAIDNMLVSLSIYLDLKGCVDTAELLVNDSFLLGNQQFTRLQSKICIQFTKYSVSIGLLAEAVQKFTSVRTSAYKGILTREDTLDYSKANLTASAYLLGVITKDVQKVNDIIAKKNSKWKNNTIKGFLMNSNNAIITNSFDIDVLPSIKVVTDLLPDVNFLFFDKPLSDELINNTDKLHKIISNFKNSNAINATEKNDVKKDFIIFNNISMELALKIQSLDTQFISLSIVQI